MIMASSVTMNNNNSVIITQILFVLSTAYLLALAKNIYSKLNIEKLNMPST